MFLGAHCEMGREEELYQCLLDEGLVLSLMSALITGKADG